MEYPTIPGRGVDLLFGKSDQRCYHHKCDKCGHWQIITLEDNIVCVNEKGVNLVEETIDDGTYQFQC